ncbi:hypothetical protein FACS189493_3790 [Spirochaetia bacterium]|nr:hypothetical protein FACS189493_3790 [Spirochaetia bacterium]
MKKILIVFGVFAFFMSCASSPVTGGRKVAVYNNTDRNLSIYLLYHDNGAWIVEDHASLTPHEKYTDSDSNYRGGVKIALQNAVSGGDQGLTWFFQGLDTEVSSKNIVVRERHTEYEWVFLLEEEK